MMDYDNIVIEVNPEITIEIEQILSGMILKDSVKHWRKVVMARKFKKFYAWFPNALARHCVNIEVLDKTTSNTETEIILDRMEKFRPSRPWTLDAQKGKMVFRFMSEDDAIMFKMQVT